MTGHAESHKRYFLHCTKGCTMLFHDKCWRPFVEALLVLRPDFDKSFKNVNKEVRSIMAWLHLQRGLE